MALPVLFWIVGGVITAGAAHGLGKEKGKREGEQKAMAKNAIKIKELENNVKNKENEIEKIKEELNKLVLKITKHYHGQQKFEQFIICLIAVGVAMAACDGDVDENEVRDLREYVLGAMGGALPAHIENKIGELFKTPPRFEQAMLYVAKLDQEVWPMIDIILAVVSEADGEVLKSERHFLQQWEAYKAMRKVSTALTQGLPTTMIENIRAHYQIETNKA